MACVAVRLGNIANGTVALEAIVYTPEVGNLEVLWDELFNRVLEDYSHNRIVVQLVEGMVSNTHLNRVLKAREEGLKFVGCVSAGPPRIEVREVVSLEEMDEEDEGGHTESEERGKRRKEGRGEKAAAEAVVKQEED